MGIDYGKKKMGLAVSDVLGDSVTMPLRTVLVDGLSYKEQANVLGQLCKRYAIGGLVVGWPMLPTGELSPQCLFVQKAMTNMQIALPTTFWDESFSSKLAESLRIERINNNIPTNRRKSDARRKKHRAPKEAIDHHAAAMILSSYMRYAIQLESCTS